VSKGKEKFPLDTRPSTPVFRKSDTFPTIRAVSVGFFKQLARQGRGNEALNSGILFAVVPRVGSTFVALIRWLQLNFRYRLRPLPNDSTELEKLAKNLQVPLAFTYRTHGLDVELAQQRIRENLDSFRWSAPLVLTTLFCFDCRHHYFGSRKSGTSIFQSYSKRMRDPRKGKFAGPAAP